MTWPVLAAAAVIGIVFFEFASIENSAAKSLAKDIKGARKAVWIRSNIDPSILWGRIALVSVHGKDFSMSGLPFFVDPTRSCYGQIGALRIELSDFNLRQLHIRELDADLHGCRFDLGLLERKHRLQLTKSGTGTAHVWLMSNDLAGYLMSKYPILTSVSCIIGKSQIDLDGVVRLGMASIPFQARALLSAHSSRQIFATVTSAFIGGRAVPSQSIPGIFDRLNPVIDVDADLGLAGSTDIQSLRLLHGQLEVVAKLHIPKIAPGLSKAGRG